MHFRETEGGFILLFTLVLLVTLLAIVAGYLFLVTTQTRVAGSQLNDAKALCLAEAGLEQGIREIRDDVLTTTQIGVADLRGFLTVSIQGSIKNRDDIRYYDEGEYEYADLKATSEGNPKGSIMTLSYFDRNYLGARIRRIQFGLRYKRSNHSGQNPRLEILYTTDGTFPQAGNTSFDTEVTYANYTPALRDITADPNWDWSGGSRAVWQQINSGNFLFRARAYINSGKTKKRVHIDYLFLKVEYEIDTNSETWFSGFNNIPLGDGEIESVNILDESGKVNINYAARYGDNTFLMWLFSECGIGSARASDIATAAINYRNGPDLRPGVAGVDDDADGFTDETDELGWPGSDDKPFDSIEEIKNISVSPALTEAEFEQIKNYVTVYSYVNEYATRRPRWSTDLPNRDAGRAPVNINTAPQVVLEAMFDQLGESLASSLATQIINRRNNAPFTCFYNSDSSVTTDFYDFIMGFSATDTQKNQILDNADSSWLIPIAGEETYDCWSTEFSYYTDSFMIDAVGRKGDSSRRLKLVIGDDGERYLDTYLEDTELSRYWREIKE